MLRRGGKIMIIDCTKCRWYYEEREFYHSSYLDCGCSHPIVEPFSRPRVSTDISINFPFNPAPGCFEISLELAPEHMFDMSFDDVESEELYFEFLDSFKGWSGDIIELLDIEE